jgi:hypothetical protein
MADDNYRQQRRKITSEDLGDDHDLSDEAKLVQKRMQEAAKSEVQEDAPRVEADYFRSMDDQPEGEGAPKLSGPAAGRYAKMFGSKQKPEASRPEEQVSSVRVTGSNKLEELIFKLRPDTGPYEQIKLPSCGRFYDDEDGPASGCLHIRPMTGEEEQILTQPRFVKKGQAINMIFQRCIKEGYKPDKLLSVDRTYMLIGLRSISYGNDYDVDVTCPFTDRKFNTTINLTELMVGYCPAKYGPDLQDTLPRTGWKFRYRLSTGKDEQDVQDYRDAVIRKGNEGKDDSLIYRTALLLLDIEGLSDKQELVMLIKKLPIQDVAYLRNSVSEPPFGVETKITLMSPYTSDEFDIDLPLETGFFFPKQRKR